MHEFYRRTHNLIQVAVITTGATAFVALLPSSSEAGWLPKVLTAVVSTGTVLDLVFDLTKKADAHQDLMRRFTELAARIAEEPATAEVLARFSAERIRIEADEPPVRRLIDLRAENDERRARRSERLVPLSYLQRTSPLAYLCDFGMASLERRNAAARAPAK